MLSYDKACFVIKELMDQEYNIQQLVSYLTGNCTKKEQELVEQWLNTSDDNMLMFNEFKQVWESSDIVNQSCLIDIDKAWGDFKKRANFVESVPAEVIENKHSNMRSIVVSATRVAALIIILFGIYFVFDNVNQVETHTYTATVAQVNSPFVLPDGSNIIMNEGVRIDYPEQFSNDIRNVSFSGEAFFDIAHNPQKPMIIEAGDVRVKVLGTSFNLCNCESNNEITLYLETGKVLFYSVNDDGGILEQIILHPGQKGVYNRSTGLITKYQFNDNNHLAWQTGVLDFVNAPLVDVISALEKTYRVDIVTEISLNNYHLTARYSNETTESIFSSLQIIYGFNYEINGTSILIY